MSDETKVTSGGTVPQAESPVTTQDLANLEVTACVEEQGADYMVIFAHNRSNFRPWAYPMPKEVAEFICGAVIANRALVDVLVSVETWFKARALGRRGEDDLMALAIAAKRARRLVVESPEAT
jgi:hypothetical protein